MHGKFSKIYIAKDCLAGNTNLSTGALNARFPLAEKVELVKIRRLEPRLFEQTERTLRQRNKTVEVRTTDVKGNAAEADPA